MSEFQGMRIPRWMIFAGLVAMALSWLPLAMIAKARFSVSAKPRVHIVPDMDNQARPEAQQASALFRDGRASRLPVEGTISREALVVATAESSGLDENGLWLEKMPVTVDRELIDRGQERFEIFCAPCHGLAGYGDGPVHQRAQSLGQGTWTPPASLHSAVVRDRADGELFNTIGHGVRNMPAYGSQIVELDRWAIVAWMRVLQISQDASVDEVAPSAVNEEG